MARPAHHRKPITVVWTLEEGEYFRDILSDEIQREKDKPADQIDKDKSAILHSIYSQIAMKVQRVRDSPYAPQAYGNSGTSG
jgi:hypothetical protein